jgi:anti-sigma factor RsiW
VTDRATLTCRRLIEFLDDYIEDSLPPAVRRDFDRHLAICPSCVAYLDGYRRTMALGRRALAPTDEPADAHVPPALAEAIRAALAARHVRLSGTPSVDAASEVP